MATRVEVKTTFEPARTIEPIYTGGDVSIGDSGRILASCVEEDVLLVDLSTGARLGRVEGDGEPTTSLVLSASASHLVVCSRSLSMRIFRLQWKTPQYSVEAILQRTLKPHDSPVVCTSIDRSGTLLATGCADGTVKVWDLNGGFTTHTFHGHGGVVSAVKFFQIGSQAAGGNSVLSRQSRDGDRKANPQSPIRFFLASGSEDGKIRIWDLEKRKAAAVLDSHVSVVRDLDYSGGENTLLSCSRDKTIILWDCRTWKSHKVIPVLEVVETAGFVNNGAICYSGGEYGRVRLWNASTGREITKEQDVGNENDAILSIEKAEGSELLLSVHLDQTLRLHSLAGLVPSLGLSTIDPLPVIQRVSGNYDEVIDLARIGSDRSLLALATNTESIRVVSLQLQNAKSHQTSDESASQTFGADVALLEGHSDIIICIDVDWSGHWLATGAKDNTARLWRIDPSKHSFTCVATFSGHAESLGAIALPRSAPTSDTAAMRDPLNHPPAFLLTGSQDRTIKRWDTSKIKISASSQPQTGIRALFTRVAHEKDINALDVSPMSPIFASASQDRTVKVWSLEDGSVAGILRGHKRGVWSIRFAPRDTPLISTREGSSSNSRGIIVSGSGDRTVRVWSLSTYQCLLTFEGHSNSVLKVVWLYPPSPSMTDSEDPQDLSRNTRTSGQNKHPFIASASSDSLIKIWSPYASLSSSTSESDNLLTTLDNHTDRIWALSSHPVSSSNPYPLISGGADATVTCWVDTTSKTTLAASKRAEDQVEQDQALQNHIHARNYREVITLCLQLNHPGRLLRVFQDVMTKGDDSGRAHPSPSEQGKPTTGSHAVDEVLASLSPSQLRLLLLRVRDWNTNARTAPVAQTILHCLLKSYAISHFIDLSKRSRESRQRVAAESGAEEVEANGDENTGADTKGVDMRDVYKALEVYTERHYRRIEELVDESYLVEYTLGEMDEVLGPLGLDAPNGSGNDGAKDLDGMMT